MRELAHAAGSRLLLALALIGTALAPPSAPAQSSRYIRYTTVAGRNYVYLRDVAAYYGMQLTPTASGCELRSRFSRVRITYDKRPAAINDVKVHFLFAPLLRGAEPLLSEQDFLLVIEPVLRSRSVPPHRVATIMIDPGHGGSDHGAIGTQYREKDLNLKLSLKLRDALLRRNYRVIMTRTGDATVSLNQRVEACARQRPDLFISVHCNAATVRDARGVETFVMTPAKAPSTSDSGGGGEVETGNRFDRQNLRLGYSVQRQLALRAGAEDRGVRHARFFVLRHASCPAILVETGFLSNPSDQARLGRDDYQNLLAELIAEGIARYNRDLQGN